MEEMKYDDMSNTRSQRTDSNINSKINFSCTYLFEAAAMTAADMSSKIKLESTGGAS